MFKLLIFSQTKKSFGARTTMDDLVLVFLLFIKLTFLWTNMFMNYFLFSSSYIVFQFELIEFFSIVEPWVFKVVNDQFWANWR
jgi:hypothetical protein